MTTITLVSVLLFVGLVSQARGADRLECYECTYFKLESETGLVENLFNAISSQNDEHCKFEKKEDIEEVGRHYCPVASEGKRSVCAVVKGEVEGEVLFGAVDFKYYTVTRQCAEINDYESDHCEDDLPSSGSLRSFLMNYFPTARNMKFSGEACYYSYLTTGADAARVSVLLLVVAMAIGLLL